MEIKNLAQQYIYWPEVDNRYQQNIDMSDVKIGELLPMLKEIIEEPQSSVTDSIITFYGLNETLARLRQEENEVLGASTLELYKTYVDETEKLSKKMFSYVLMICIMEARHCRDYSELNGLENQYKYEPAYENGTELEREALKKEAQEKIEIEKDKLIDKYMSILPSEGKVDREKFKLFHNIIAPLSGLDSYSRNQIQLDLLPVLSEAPYNQLTVHDMLVSVKAIFDYNNFSSSSYGGKAWANIAEHGVKFVEGKLNAEVFVDQAFSLEHNGGQIFNKKIMFKPVDSYYWRSANLDDNDSMDHSNEGVLNSQLCLNAQHQGQLLSLLKNDYSLSIHDIMKSLDVKGMKKSGMLPDSVTEDNFDSVGELIKENLRGLKSIFGEYRERNPKIVEKLDRFNVNIPAVDMYTVLNGCKTKDRNDGAVFLADRYKGFHKLTNHIITKGYKHASYQNTDPQVPYEFSFDYLDTKAVPAEKMDKKLLGNKAFGLAEMHEKELPVPNALVFPATNAASFYNEKAKWVNSLRPHLNKITDYFKDKDGNPIACSVRSGSAVSMPGMMDTILNVGIDDSNYPYFCEKMGVKVVNECVTKFMSLFSKSLLGEDIKFSEHFSKALFQFRDVLSKHEIAQDYESTFPLNARQQYKWCLQAVFSSWHSERANAYRDHQGISHDIGTAAIVQQMVFGNLNEKSCTGVVFSRDCISGEKGIIGEFLPKAQGEDVVSGAVTPKNIREMQAFNPKAYGKLLEICESLEKETGDIQDIEFTIENGDLYILQKRKAVCSSLAQSKLNQELYDLGLISKEQMLKSIKLDSLISKDVVDSTGRQIEGQGLVGNPGVMRGIVVRNESEMQEYSELYEANKRDVNFGWIFYAPETSPEHAPIMLKTQAFITSNGGFTSHAAILSRSWDKPCVVGMGDVNNPLFESGSLITVDANNGHVYRGIVPLKESNNTEITEIVNRVLEHYKVNLEEVSANNPFESLLTEINSSKSWMEKLQNAQPKQEEAAKPKINKFVSLGQKVAMMLVKAQEQEDRKGEIVVPVTKVIEVKEQVESQNPLTSQLEKDIKDFSRALQSSPQLESNYSSEMINKLGGLPGMGKTQSLKAQALKEWDIGVTGNISGMVAMHEFGHLKLPESLGKLNKENPISKNISSKIMPLDYSGSMSSEHMEEYQVDLQSIFKKIDKEELNWPVISEDFLIAPTTPELEFNMKEFLKEVKHLTEKHIDAPNFKFTDGSKGGTDMDFALKEAMKVQKFK